MRREFLSLEVAVDAVFYNVVFLKMGPPLPLIVYFRSFQTQNLQKNQ